MIPVRQLEVIFTDRCNLNCTYCFEKDKKGKTVSLDDLKAVVDQSSSVEFYMFGGEPFLAIDLVADLIDYIEKTVKDEARKDQLIRSIRPQISNGTIALQHINIIKKYKLEVQVSIDGPPSIHDRNRGEGSFNAAMDCADKLHKLNVPVSIHGALSRNNYHELSRITKFFFNNALDWDGPDEAVRCLSQNIFQVVFEDEVTDDDIDIFLEQIKDFCDWLRDHPELTEAQRKQGIANFLLRRGSSCIAGNKMFTVDTEWNLYPCHRIGMANNSSEFRMGNYLEGGPIENVEKANTFLQIDRDRCMYSSTKNNKEWKGFMSWMNWCPAANAEKGTSVFHQHSKHNRLVAEIENFGVALANYYKLDLIGYRRRMNED